MIDTSFNKFYYVNNKNNIKCLVYVDGANNISLSNSIQYTNPFILGGYQNSYLINSPRQIELSFNRNLIKIDELINFTGCNFIEKAYLLRDKYYYQIDNLYLTNYSASFTVGDIPQINTKFVSYDSKVSYIDHIDEYGNLFYEDNYFDIIKLDSIKISGDYGSLKLTNLINQIDYSININRQPMYGVGTESAYIQSIYPIEINLSISSIASSTEFKEIQPEIISKEFNFSILVSGVSGMMNFPAKNMKNTSNQISLTENNMFQTKNNFLGYVG